MSALKNLVDSYVAGMEAAASMLPVDAVGKSEQSLPDCVRGRAREGGLLVSGILFTLTDGEGKQFTCEVGLDSFKCCSGCLCHVHEPTEAVA